MIVAATFGSVVSSCSKAPGAPTSTRAASELTVASRPAGAAGVVTWECLTASRAGVFASGASGCAAIGLLAAVAGPAAVSAPGTPSNLTSAVSGSIVMLTWLPAGGGDAAASVSHRTGF
jgi:hypothetical protein